MKKIYVKPAMRIVADDAYLLGVVVSDTHINGKAAGGVDEVVNDERMKVESSSNWGGAVDAKDNQLWDDSWDF